LADRIAVTQKGELVEIGETEQVVTASRHPYTQKLLAATPEMQNA
jgi:peptide/nickel transport system ATP-binding protein